MISALAWVRKGIAAQQPVAVEYTEEELQQFQQEAQLELEAAQKALSSAPKGEKDQSEQEQSKDQGAENFDDLAEFDMDNYDNEENMEIEQQIPEDALGLSMFSNTSRLLQMQTSENEEADPYIDLDDGDNQSEIEELEVDPRDNMIIAAKTELDISTLEIYIYEGEMENLYVHHDIMLPSLPLCIEWIGHKLGKQKGNPGIGNYIAVGTFEPTIEIWNLDVVEVMMPELTLGAQPRSGFATHPFVNKKTKKKNKKAKNKGKSDDFDILASLESHTDAVMSLSWNKSAMNILASSSADKTVKLWDLNTTKSLKTFSHHKDKVQTVQWHPSQPPILITGSFDRSIAVVDTRTDAKNNILYKFDSDVEGVSWDIHNDNCFYANLENGQVMYYDIRSKSNGKNDGRLFTIDAHTNSSCSALDIHPTIKNCIVTAGTNDRTVKVWNTQTTEGNVSLVVSRDLNIGKLFTAKFCPDSDFEIAIGGDGGSLVAWDLSFNPGITSAFGISTEGKKRKTKPVVTASTGNQGGSGDDERTETLIAELQGGGSFGSGNNDDDDDEDYTDQSDDDYDMN